MSILSIDDPGKQLLYMGNEAIARGAIESGVRVCAAYPGNPSSEIIASLAKVGKELGIYVEWSVNEKVALEVAAGASFAGIRSLCAMKHNGLNVAVDFLYNLNLTGTGAGMVVIVADDPLALSSSNEQDTRHYARMGDLPLLEPGTFQEGKDMVKTAFEMSEELGIPVMLRSVTRFSHARGNVTLGEIPRGQNKPFFDVSKPRLPKPVEKTHKLLHEKLATAGQKFEDMPFNLYQGPDQPELLILTCGTGWYYTKEALHHLNATDRVGIAKVGTSWPLPAKFITEQLAKSQRVLFVEEIDPFLESNVKAFYAQNVQELGPKEFLGKISGNVAAMGENTPDSVMAAIAGCLDNCAVPARDQEHAEQAAEASKRLATTRALALCAGCPHRATYWAVKNALALDGRGGFVVGDIGCYAQGRGPSGFQQMKTMHAMGSGAGVANGFGQLTRFGMDQPVLAVCGDSTFFHAAIPALTNARYNGSNLLMLVLDNSATAMTGFQPHPGTGRTAMGDTAPVVDVTKVCQSLGAEVIVLDPFDIQKTTETIYELLQKQDGIKILVLKQVCAMVRTRMGKRLYKVRVDESKCLGDSCGCNKYCSRVFKCPGLTFDKTTGKAGIDEAICNGCGVCASLCPESAIIKEAL